MKVEIVYYCVLPVGGVADLLVLFELVTDHLQELVRVSTEVLHKTHQILDGLLNNDGALEKRKRTQLALSPQLIKPSTEVPELRLFTLLTKLQV